MSASEWQGGSGLPTDKPLRADASQVLVDVVVKDSRGRALRGLKASDVRVLENGVSQQVLSFTEVTKTGTLRDDAEVTVQGRAGQALSVNRQIRLVSLVFERLGMQARPTARQAALDFLANDLGANVYYAVFYIDRRFQPVCSYTNDKARLKKAIEQATGGDPTGLSGDAKLTARATYETAEEAITNAAARSPEASDLFTGVMNGMAKFNERADRQLFGQISIFGMWGMVQELGRLPGRKAVVLFSEGLSLPDTVMTQYRAMVDAANRANVSIHTVDARGLVVGRDQVLANRLMGEALKGLQDTRDEPLPELFSGVAGSDMIPTELMAPDRTLDALRGNGQLNLSDLAETTGGMAIANTNDFRKPLRELSEEFNTYYEVSYAPADRNYDGRYRTIEVQVAAKGAHVLARKGYFALPPMKGDTVFPYEVPLLGALGRPELPRDVEFRAGVVQFGERNGERQASLVFDVLLKNVTFTPVEAGKRARSHLAVLALLKDEKGQVVAKLSRDVPLTHPKDRVEGYRPGHFIVTRPIGLEPGRYTLESVAADHEAGRFGARRQVVVVPRMAAGPYLSELALVRRLDALKGEREEGDLLVMNGERVVPTLAGVVPGGRDRMAAVFLLVYPEAGQAEGPRLKFEVLRDGRVLNTGAPPLPAKNEAGAYPYVVNIGVQGLEAAEYELRATVVQGGRQMQRSLFFTIEGGR